MHGQFAWYELTTPDPEAAKGFYQTFTGWGTEQFDADYTLFTSGGVPVAGVFRLTDEMRSRGTPPNWMPYVEVKNVDETVGLATSLGGQTMFGPTDVPNTGRIAVIQDPQGAAIGVYKPTSGAPSWDGTPVVGRFSWNELMTSDHLRAFDFYRRIFGWDQVGEMDLGGGAMYRMFGKGNAMYGGMFTRPAEMANMHPFWLCYIHVKSVPRSLDIATAAGAFVQRPPTDIPDGVFAILGDPQGAGFALHHSNAPAPAPKPSKGGASGGQKSKGSTGKSASKTSVAKVKARPEAKAKPKSKVAARRGGATKSKGAKKSKAKSAANARTKSKSATRAKGRGKMKSGGKASRGAQQSRKAKKKK
jgi:predicted enzyme related to lactoylglutathione lyase